MSEFVVYDRGGHRVGGVYPTRDAASNALPASERHLYRIAASDPCIACGSTRGYRREHSILFCKECGARRQTKAERRWRS